MSNAPEVQQLIQAGRATFVPAGYVAEKLGIASVAADLPSNPSSTAAARNMAAPGRGPSDCHPPITDHMP